MALPHILIFSLFSLLVGWLTPPRWRTRTIFFGSLVALYTLQPSTPIRNLDFWLPTASIILTIFTWTIVRSTNIDDQHSTRLSILVIVSTVLLLGATRYIEPLCCLTPTRPPAITQILVMLFMGGGLAVLPYRLNRQRPLSIFAILLILTLFLILKTEALTLVASKSLRTLNGQTANLAQVTDLPWLGFSYLAFRLLHALRDQQSGKFIACSLEEFLTYTLFFPALTAGPIDRAQHFIPELGRQNQTSLNSWKPDAPKLLAGGQRIVLGIFKKFVLADSLALIALNSQNATQTSSAVWLWVLLYAYALRIYFDFSGYTDIAIGLGNWLGIQLPENFDHPYQKTNLTVFWNSWHITLSQWFRAYFFNPLTRFLRSCSPQLPIWAVILIGQLSIMLLIGLWHGVSWNFIAWGAWHGLGLFIHNRWSDWIRPHLPDLEDHSLLLLALQASGWLLTFHYVTLGWIWFALPDITTAQTVFQKLLGF